jgi:hypothetical protein
MVQWVVGKLLGGEMASANLIIVLLVGTAVGALVGLGLGGIITHPLYLAIVAGLIAIIVAGIVRNTIMTRTAFDPDVSRVPFMVLVYAAIASLAGSAAAVEIDHASGLVSPVWIGTMAGLISAVLMALLMITYHMSPPPPPKRR